MEKRIIKLSRMLLRVFNKFAQNEKKPRRFGVDELLHPSEIHMVMLIGDNPGGHGAELARIAGVTRGAVSQIIAKLEKKGIVEKIDDPENGLKKVPILTNKGKVAYYAHEQYHEEMDKGLYDYVARLTDEQVAVIENFLRGLEKMADRRR
ncbi:MarR family transcriptional regulator [uncultured Desulfosarcina sp.]|uniref:MarR family winged helix-turn-helix transcriptional regulator n=1 Tax=uncultured Desulfosarcina sp. TaxID=218289 RepID=UPI0029C8CEC3|nr:MarR family transcriptional regulator [uncultured Desulfosarcina sp.]